MKVAPGLVRVLVAGAAFAQNPGVDARLTRLTGSDLAIARRSADVSLLPSHSSGVRFETKQVSHLTAPGQPELWFVPAHFAHGEPWEMSPSHELADRDRCGLFVMKPGGVDQYFLYTLNEKQDLAVDQCGGLKAIARAGGGPHPDLKLTYRTFAPPRAEDSVNVQLLWDVKSGRYAVGRASD